MKKHKIIFSLFLAAALSITACNESTVNIEPIGDTEDVYFQNETQMTEAVMGIYQKVSFFYAFRSNNALASIWLLPDDNLTTQGGQEFENFVGLNASNGRLNDYYRYSYQLIARANTLLEKIDLNRSIAYANNPELADYHRGEALFLRSWMYFRLWNTFGNAAPIVNKRITLIDNAYPPSSTGTQLLDSAIKDLHKAAELLPASWNDENKGRVTKNSAFGLAGKVLVFRGTVTKQNSDFTAAMVDFGNISGVSLMPNYGDNFDATKENNSESLFEFQATDQPNETNPFLNNDEFSVVGEIGFYNGYFTQEPDWINNDFYTITESFKNALETGDPRIPYIINPDATDLKNVVKYSKDGNRTGNWSEGYNIQQNNPRILRYADILLLKAEALVRSGGSKSEAIALINEIRGRARMSTSDGVEAAIPADLNTSETDEATILNWIFNEKRIEFAFEEGNRWFDLRRRYIAEEIDLTTWDFSSLKPDFKFKATNVSFPIPVSEVIQNPKLVQNPGY